MKTCGDCKHWGDDMGRVNNDPVRQCQAIKHRNKNSFVPKTPHPIASTCDESDYESSLNTRDDFACILFEEKPSEVS